MSESRRSRKFKKSNKPIVFIILIVLIACIVIFVKKKYFSNKELDVLKQTAKNNEESIVNEIANMSTAKKDSEFIDVGEIFTFGSYPQSDTSGNVKEPIEWLVLDEKDGAKLLLSKYILDCRAYNNEYVDTTWASCSLRFWLNDEFLNTAFDIDEYSKIQKTALINDDNSDYNTDGGSDTDDRVFCLSEKEVLKYFGTGTKEGKGFNIGKSIATTATNYAKKVDNNGAKLLVNDNNDAWYLGYSGFWLRTPGEVQYATSNVGSDGYLTTVGANVTFGEIGVRPAIWVYE